MAEIAGVTVDFNASPRIITIPSPLVTASIQDLHDTIVAIEDELSGGIEFNRLVSSAGKEGLGGGILVGITMTLQNADLAFEARPGPSFVQCVISGGNLTAVDDLGASINPVQTTAFTQVVLAQSSSATLLQAADLVTLRKLQENKLVTDPVTGILTLFDDDGVTPLRTWDIWEDVAELQRYRGQGIEVRDPIP